MVNVEDRSEIVRIGLKEDGESPGAIPWHRVKTDRMAHRRQEQPLVCRLRQQHDGRGRRTRGKRHHHTSHRTGRRRNRFRCQPPGCVQCVRQGWYVSVIHQDAADKYQWSLQYIQLGQASCANSGGGSNAPPGVSFGRPVGNTPAPSAADPKPRPACAARTLRRACRRLLTDHTQSAHSSSPVSERVLTASSCRSVGSE